MKFASSSSGCRPAWLTTGTNSFIGLNDETTVLKYLHIPGDEEALALLGLEARILQAIGPCKHIIGFRGTTKHGLLLERAPFWSLNSSTRLVSYHPNATENFFRFITSNSDRSLDNKGEIITLGLGFFAVLLGSPASVFRKSFISASIRLVLCHADR